MPSGNANQHGPALGRRAFLGASAAGALPFVAGAVGNAAEGASAPAAEAGYPGLVTRQFEPKNLEFPFPTLGARVLPNNRFFVRSHFRVPTVDAAAWRLAIDGEVRMPLELSLADLRKLPARTAVVTTECAGNGRSFLVPQAAGVQWELGGVGTAEWTGVPLSALLDKAGVKESAVETILAGADEGETASSPGAVRYERSLPLDKARRPEVLLAYAMNGRDLPPEHGFPVRAVVAGWYGMASVKWLTRVTLVASPFDGYWQTTDYSYWKRENGRPMMTPVAGMLVKSEIARPCLHETVAAGSTYRVRGAAWAGEADVAKAEFSADGGGSWQPAKLVGENVPFAWRQWECEWNVPATAGRVVLMSRATDSRGEVQPVKHDKDRRAYMINHTLPVEVEIV